MPLTIPDQSIALQAKAPDGMASLASMLNIAGGAQALKKAQATYNSDVSQRASDASIADSAAAVAKANVQPLIDQQSASTSTAQTGATAAKFALNKDYANTALQTASGLLADPRIAATGADYDPEKATDAIVEARKQMIAKGVPESQAEIATAPFTNAVHAPGAVQQMLKNTIAGQLNAAGQVAAATPSIVQNNDGQHVFSTNVNPLAPGGVGSQPIAPIQQQLPPTTPTMVNGTPGYLGPQASQGHGGFDPSKLSAMQLQFLAKTEPEGFKNGLDSFAQRGQQAPSRVVSGAPIGVGSAIEGTQGAINDHWKQSIAASNTAQQDIGVLQNIKQHAAGAATGIAADKKTLAAGIAGMLGMDEGELAKTNADLLAKNSAMLALAGGDTNLARTMAEAATPNSHMTKEAIVQAADQVIAQRKLALARTQFLTPFKAMADQGHPEMYNNALNQFNSVADPRVIQFSSMSPEERIHMKTSMTPQERTEFGAKLGKARSLGVAQ